MGRIRKYSFLLVLVFTLPLHSSSIGQADPVAAVAQAAQALMQLREQSGQAKKEACNNLLFLVELSGQSAQPTEQNSAQTQSPIANPATGKYQCAHCQKSFTRLSDFKKHERIHTGEKPFSCKHCGKSFSDGSVLRRHERTHTGEKPYACQHCDKSFANIGNLRRHERTHTREKPYTCQHCGQSFSDSSNLREHERTHTGEKQCVCAHCGKSITRERDLEKHIRIHTGEKPYACKQCNKSFPQSSSLREHERTQHNQCAPEAAGKVDQSTHN